MSRTTHSIFAEAFEILDREQPTVADLALGDPCVDVRDNALIQSMRAAVIAGEIAPAVAARRLGLHLWSEVVATLDDATVRRLLGVDQ